MYRQTKFKDYKKTKINQILLFAEPINFTPLDFYVQHIFIHLNLAKFVKIFVFLKFFLFLKFKFQMCVLFLILPTYSYQFIHKKQYFISQTNLFTKNNIFFRSYRSYFVASNFRVRLAANFCIRFVYLVRFVYSRANFCLIPCIRVIHFTYYSYRIRIYSTSDTSKIKILLLEDYRVLT